MEAKILLWYHIEVDQTDEVRHASTRDGGEERDRLLCVFFFFFFSKQNEKNVSHNPITRPHARLLTSFPPRPHPRSFQPCHTNHRRIQSSSVDLWPSASCTLCGKRASSTVIPSCGACTRVRFTSCNRLYAPHTSSSCPLPPHLTPHPTSLSLSLSLFRVSPLMYPQG